MISLKFSKKGTEIVFMGTVLFQVFLSACGNSEVNASEKSADQKVRDHSSSAISVIADDRNSETPTMIELYTPQCPSCRQMEPIVEGLVEKCNHKGVTMETVDVSLVENEPLVEKYMVRAVPTFLFLDENGVEVARLIGSQTEQALKQALAVLRGEECPGMSKLERSRDGGRVVIGG